MAPCCLRLGNIILLKIIPLPTYPGAVPLNDRRSFGPLARLVLSNFGTTATSFSVQLFSNFIFVILTVTPCMLSSYSIITPTTAHI
jgi:hypothetical protein